VKRKKERKRERERFCVCVRVSVCVCVCVCTRARAIARVYFITHSQPTGLNMSPDKIGFPFTNILTIIHLALKDGQNI
jgi:hypothetical protein